MRINQVFPRFIERSEEKSCIDRGSTCNKVMESFGNLAEYWGSTLCLGAGMGSVLWMGSTLMAGYDVVYAATTAARLFAIPLMEGGVIWFSGYGIRKTAEMP